MGDQLVHPAVGNIQEVCAPDGWPLWTSQVRPGREHDTTAARTDPELLDQIRAWVDDGNLGPADMLRIPIKKPADGELTVDQQAYNAVHAALRCRGERARTRCSRPPSKRSAAGAAARGASATSSPPLVVLHHEHRRIT
jgi:hypothetical protein